MPEPYLTSPNPLDSNPLTRFSRTIDLLGQEGFAKLRSAYVVVIGLGGVGSHAASALIRAGVGRLKLIDFDKVTWSSLNRNAWAAPKDVGYPKVTVLSNYLQVVDPEACIEAVEAFFHADTATELLAGPPHFVIDAIDSFNPKVALLEYCFKHHIPVISCMGSSARTDPTMLRIGDISETRICPLARVVRRRLHQLNIRQGIQCIYSVESPRDPLPPDLSDETLRRGRIRNRLPSWCILPGIFGFAAAGMVVQSITNGNNP